MDDCRGLLLRARAVARPTEAARLNEEADAVLAARAAAESPWGSELPPPFLQKVLELLQWEPAVCGVVRAVCSTWCGFLDALLPRLVPRGSAVVMKGKLGWYQCVTEVDLTECEGEDASSVLAELGSMPSLCSLTLPSWCAESVVDTEVVYGLTTLTSLHFCDMKELDENGEPVEEVEQEVGEWVVDLSRLATLSSLNLWMCVAVTDTEVLALSNLTGLTSLNLFGCINATSEGLCAVSSLTALSTLRLSGSNVTSQVLRAVSSLTALTGLDICDSDNVTSEGLCAVSSLTALSTLSLSGCAHVTSEVLRSVSSLTALTFLGLCGCENVPAEGLRAVSNLTKLIALDLSSCNLTTEGLRAVSRLTTLKSLGLCYCPNLTDEVLRAMSSLTALEDLIITLCGYVSAAAKQALRTALPNLTIHD
jgi:hypothetical protein